MRAQGPLTLADFIGLDTCLSIMQARPRSPLCLEQLSCLLLAVLCLEQLSFDSVAVGVAGCCAWTRHSRALLEPLLCVRSLLGLKARRCACSEVRASSLLVCQVLHTGFGDSKYRPAPLLQQYVDAGLLGRKTK